MRVSRASRNLPLMTPVAPRPGIKKISTRRPGSMRSSRSVARTFYLSGNQQFPGGHADAMGRRPTMEDACVCIGEFLGPRTQYYAVFDGHGGREVSTYCAEKLHLMISNSYKKGEPFGPIIKQAIFEINQIVLSQYEYAGTTAAIAIIIDDTIYTANVGDSRVILIHEGKAKRLSVDHKATTPKERKAIIRRGGSIFQGRVNGILMLSRAIGDATVARYISAEPYQTETTLKEGMKLILACDGVWDVMTDQNAADIFLRSFEPVEAARSIKNEALKRGSTDNVSVICVDLKYRNQTQNDNETTNELVELIATKEETNETEKVEEEVKVSQTEIQLPVSPKISVRRSMPRSKPQPLDMKKSMPPPIRPGTLTISKPNKLPSDTRPLRGLRSESPLGSLNSSIRVYRNPKNEMK